MAVKNKPLFISNFSMKRFILQFGLFFVFVLLSCYLVFMQADGSTDAFYVKFTTPQQASLIIGSSRAAQGLQPQVIYENLHATSIYNYAFSRIHTPYGKPYFESIKRKLKSDTKDGIFIVEVNPWSISQKKDEILDSLHFSENASYLGAITKVSTKPNLTYLLNFYDGRNIEIITKKGENYHGESLFVHDDGWFEVSLKDADTKRKQRIQNTVNSYSKIRNDYVGLSDVRLAYLKQTLLFLKNHGHVYIVRLPIASSMLAIETSLMPDFDTQMLQLAKELDVPYFNFMGKRTKFNYIDGHHLDIVSGEFLTKIIADSIQFYKSQR
jgi:hypothetical protein